MHVVRFELVDTRQAGSYSPAPSNTGASFDGGLTSSTTSNDGSASSAGAALPGKLGRSTTGAAADELDDVAAVDVEAAAPAAGVAVARNLTLYGTNSRNSGWLVLIEMMAGSPLPTTRTLISPSFSLALMYLGTCKGIASDVGSIEHKIHAADRPSCRMSA